MTEKGHTEVLRVGLPCRMEMLIAVIEAVKKTYGGQGRMRYGEAGDWATHLIFEMPSESFDDLPVRQDPDNLRP